MRIWFATLAALAVATVLAGCVSAPGALARGSSLSDDLAQLERLPAPAGVGEATWVGLKSALADLLTAQAQGGRIAATAPLADASQAPLSFDAPTLTLEWPVFNQGDYDQNGEVNISDLAPLASRLGETSAGGGPFDPATSQSVVDGDNNGEINISDLSPLASNFGRVCGSYNVYRSLSAADLPADNADPNGPGAELLGTVPLTNAVGNASQQRRRMSFTLASANLAWFYWVRPNDSVDGSGQDGTPSTLVSLGGNAGNQAPVAALSASPSSGTVPLLVNFDAGGSSDPDGANGDINDIVQFEWDFESDGVVDQTTATPTAQHKYVQPGVVQATLRILDAGAASDGASVSIGLASDIDSPPVASLTADLLTGDVPFDVTLDAGGSNDDGGLAALTFDWDFDGDGVFDQNTGHTPVVVHSYNTAGGFATVVKVTDDGGQLDVAAVTVTATVAGNLPPEPFLAPSSSSGAAPNTVIFDPSQSGDPDGSIVLYRYDFDGDRSVDMESTTPGLQTVTYGAAGTYEAVLEVVDNQAARAQAVSTIEVTGGWEINRVAGVAKLKSVTDLAIAPFNKGSASDSRLHVAFALTDRSINHVQSANNLGTAWGSPVVVNFNGSSIPNATLHLGVVKLRPAIAYMDDQAGVVRYVRSSDENGSAWGNPFTAAGQSDGCGPALAIVNGNPAISFFNGGTNTVRYTRAVPDTGEGSWSASVTALNADGLLSQVGFPRTHLQQTSGGEPGIICNCGTLLAVIAKNTTGSDWDAGAHFVTASPTLSFGAIFEDSDSGIAAAVIDPLAGDPSLVSSTTENAFGLGSGSGWDNGATIVAGPDLAPNVVLRRHNSKAAVLYVDTSLNTLNFVQSTSSTGLTWDPPQVIDFGVSGAVFDLIQINGSLVAVYFRNQGREIRSATLP